MGIIFQEGFDLTCASVMNIDADLEKVLDAHNLSNEYVLYGNFTHSDIRTDVTDNFFPLAIRGWTADVYKSTNGTYPTIDNQIMKLIPNDIHGNGTSAGDSSIVPKQGHEVSATSANWITGTSNGIAANVPTQGSLKLASNSQVKLTRNLTTSEQFTLSKSNTADADTVYISFAVKLSNANNSAADPDNVDLLMSDGLYIGNNNLGCIFIRHDGNDIRYLRKKGSGVSGFESVDSDDYELQNTNARQAETASDNGELWIKRGFWHQFVVRIHCIQSKKLSISINIDGVDRCEVHDIDSELANGGVPSWTIDDLWITKIQQKNTSSSTYWIDNLILEAHSGVNIDVQNGFSTFNDPRYKERFIISLPSTEPKDISRSDADQSTSYQNEHSILKVVKDNIADSAKNPFYVLSEPTVTNLRINTVAQGGTVMDRLKVSHYTTGFDSNDSPSFDISSGYISNFSYDLDSTDVTGDDWFDLTNTVATKVMFTHEKRYGHTGQSGYPAAPIQPQAPAALVTESTGTGIANAQTWISSWVPNWLYDENDNNDNHSFIEKEDTAPSTP
jgi:hypothetical protein